jgi:hypothetical protein
MAASFSLTSGSYKGRTLTLSCTQTKDITNNKSTINWTLTSAGGENNYYDVGPTKVYINGTEVYSKSRVSWSAKTFPAAKGSVSGSLTVSHNNDGNKSISVSFSTAIYTATVSTYSGTWELDSNPRQANITGAPNFNDEENPTITYSNPAGNAVNSLEACISWTGNADIAYRDISKTGSSYTFNLTEAERKKLRQAAASSNTLSVKFFVTTTIGDNTYYSALTKTLTIKNPDPTLSPTVIDSNATTTALTGDTSKFVKYYSNAQFSVGATAVKEASIKNRKVVCGARSSTAATGTLNAVESGTFVFSTTDSRGNSVTKTLTKTLINYVKLTCNLITENPTTDGKMNFEISGNYFNGSFGTVANTLTVQYRYKENNGAYGSWITATATKNSNTYSATINLTGLNYQSTYTIQAMATDKLATKQTAEKKVKSTPVFDWGENDFKFNVDAYDKNGNKIGTEITAENQAAVAVSGNILQETGFVSITPVANTPTSAAVKFKKTYKKIPTIVMSVASGVPGTQVLGYGQTGISTTGVNIVVTRTNTTPTILYYYVFGEVAD